MNDFFNAISSFFYDFICRVIPGALVCYILVNDKFVEHKSPLINAAFIIVFWAIGLTLDIATEGFGRLILHLFRKGKSVQAKKQRPQGFLAKIRDGITLYKMNCSVFGLPQDWRASLVQSIAYRSFFRALVVICWLLAGLRFYEAQLMNHDVFSWVDTPMWLDKKSPWLFVILSVLFFLCWLRSGMGISGDLRSAEEWIEKQPCPE